MRYYNPKTGAITLTLTNKTETRVVRFPGQQWSEDVPLELEGSPELTAARNAKKLLRERKTALSAVVAVRNNEVTAPPELASVVQPLETPEPRIFELNPVFLPSYNTNNDDDNQES